MTVFDTNLSLAGATTKYADFDFDSICEFNGNFYAASDEGLYKIDEHTFYPGESTATEDIESYFELGDLDFGLSNQKKCRHVYIGYESDGDLTLKVSTELSEELTYTLLAQTTSQKARKITLSRKLKGRYWTFKIYGNGANFAIDSIVALLLVRSHGFDKN